MGFFKKKRRYPQEQLELHQTALELKGIAINLQKTANVLEHLVKELKENPEDE